MPIDPDTSKYSESLFDQRFEDEIRPSYLTKLKEAIARWNPDSRLLFSGSQAQVFIAVEADYAREAARAQAESLIEALSKAGLPFDDDAFRKGIEDTKILLEKHSGYSYRKVMGHFSAASVPAGAAKGVEQSIDNEMRHIYDSLLRLLKVRLQESVITSRVARQQVTRAEDHDSQFASAAIDEARRSVSEQDGKPHPKVGAVVVKGGRILSSAHRGEAPGNHAEFLALDKKLPDEAVAGATVYTTLEPCTTRNPPKIPCVKRIIDRKIARVVIGMTDPDPRITGRGMLALRAANIEIAFFPADLMREVEELNREFIRLHEQQSQPQQQKLTGDAGIDLRESLRTFAEQKRQVHIGPQIPASEHPLFLVEEADPARIIVKKLSSSQVVSIPRSRITDIFFGAEVNEPPTLHLNGRLQWLTASNEWKFFPESPPASEDGHLGFGKAVGGLQDPYVLEVAGRLHERSYHTRWFRRENLPVLGGGSDGNGWQLFYDTDGRFLVIRNSREVLILAVQWNFSG